MHIEFKGTSTLPEFRRALFRVWFLTLSNFVAICLGFILLIISLIIRIHNEHYLWEYTLMLLGAYYIAIRPIMLWERIKTMYNEAQCDIEITTIVTDDDFRVYNAISDCKYRWEMFKHVTDQSGILLLYNKNGLAYLVFKRQLSPQQLTEFTAFLKEKKLLK